MSKYIVRKNCEYSIVVEADNQESAAEEADRLYPNLNNWQQAWSVPDAESYSTLDTECCETHARLGGCCK